MFWRKSVPAPDTNAPQSAAAPVNFPPRDAAERAALVQFIREAPVAHGPWQQFKKLFKDIEAQPQADTALLAAMLSRADGLPMRLPVMRGDVWDEVPEGAPRARWDSGRRCLIVRDAAGQEGSLAFSGFGQAVQLGTLAVVVAGERNKAQISFVDVADATQPALLATRNLEKVNSWNALAFAARRDNLLIFCFRVSNPYNHFRLMVFDVSQPLAPRSVASLMIGQSYHFQAAFDGTRLFFLGGDWNRTQLKVVDLSDPSKPKLGSGVDAGSAGWRRNLVAANNGFAYVVFFGREMGLKIVDARNAAKPRAVGTLPIKNIMGVTIEGGRVYARVDARLRGEGEERGIFRVIDDTDPTQPKLLGAPPTSRTIGYLKRRARRLLWKLAEENPALYVDLTTRLIQAGDALNYEDHWLSVDAIFGGGKRFAQRRHGRAGYVLNAPRFIFKRREERFPSAWDAHPDAAQRLWQSENVPVEAREMALKILRANKLEIPVIAPRYLEELLRSASPVLQSYASRALWQHAQNGEALNGGAAALMLLAAPGNLRDEIERWTQNTKWSKDERRAFGAQLQRAVAQTRPDGQDVPWRRRSFAAKLLAGAWSEFLDQNAVMGNLAFWLNIGDAELEARVLEQLRKSGAVPGDQLAAQLGALARQLLRLDEAVRERFFDAFLQGATERTLSGEDALSLVNQDDTAVLGWRVLEKTRLDDKAQDTLWNTLFRGHASAGALSQAFSNPVALRVFETAALGERLRAWVETNNDPLLFASPEFFETLLRALPHTDYARTVFRALALMPTESADKVWDKHAALAENFSPARNDFQRANFSHQLREAGARAWDFLARSQVTAEALREMWTAIFQYSQWSPFSRAFTHPAAPALLRRAEFPPESMAAFLRQYPAIIERASPEFYLAILDIVPGEMRLQMLTSVTPERWLAAREPLLRSLEEPAARAAFWQAIWEKLGADASELQERLLGDEAIVATFERIEAPAFEAFLKTDSPSHEPWILRWLRVHKPEKGDQILLLAATHNLPGVRKWALSRAEYLRLDLMTALRLLEAELPDCIAAGRKFFESLPPGADDEQNYALALCDSPGYAARGFGREFIEARRETLFNGDLLAKLAQHSSPDMQAWLAEKLLQNAAPAQATAPFDRAILRARGRARKAKNLVQARHENHAEAAPDNATLLELARGRTKRDADWALRQLAQKAMSGEKIEGVEVVQ